MIRLLPVLVVIVLSSASRFAPPVAAQGAQVPPPPTLTAAGLFPVYDSSAEMHGEDLAAHLLPAIYQSFRELGRELVLLNPGGSYSLVDEDASLEYARAAGVQVALVTKFAPTSRESQSDGSPVLNVDVRAIDVKTGATLHTFSVSEQVRRKELEKGFDKGPGFHRQWIVFQRFHDKSRKVEKQALGKALGNLADAIRTNVLSFKGGSVIVYPSAALHHGPFPASCPIEFSVGYTRQKSTSKAYSLFINDRDESSAIKNDGVTPVTVRSGLNVFDVVVRDAPYRLPAQKTYAINRWVECSAEEKRLVLEIGGAGEALMVARP